MSMNHRTKTLNPQRKLTPIITLIITYNHYVPWEEGSLNINQNAKIDKQGPSVKKLIINLDGISFRLKPDFRRMRGLQL
jgi:hypothetical protein